MSDREKGFTLIELMMVVAIIAIISAIAIPNLLVAIQRSRQRRTMVDMRNLATAWEARSVETGRYNAAGAGLPGIDQPVDIRALNSALSPTYIKRMPVQDGWGNPYEAFLDRPWSGSVQAQSYALVSSGRDGSFSTSATFGTFQNFDCDIIYSNGSFLAFPEGASTAQ